MIGLRQRLRAEEGFGLVELMISLVVLNVGILAIVAGFNAGSLALLRASETSTAAMLGDRQIELYRAMTYPAISLNTTAVDGTYTGDTAYPGDTGDRGLHCTGRCCLHSDADGELGQHPAEPRRPLLPDRHLHHSPHSPGVGRILGRPPAQARDGGRSPVEPVEDARPRDVELRPVDGVVQVLRRPCR